MNKKIIIAVGVLIAIAAAMAIIFIQFGMPSTTQGEKNITVSVVLLEGEPESFNYTTDAEFLGDVLLEEGLVNGEMGDYGLYVTEVNGVVADDAKQQWWMLSIGGESTTTGFDTTPINDGDAFEITLVEGY